MWRCPECEIVMKFDDERCRECKKQLQYFENVKNVPLENMLVQVKVSEMEEKLKYKKPAKTYWQCPTDGWV